MLVGASMCCVLRAGIGRHSASWGTSRCLGLRLRCRRTVLSKLALINRVPRQYDQAAIQEVVRLIETQGNQLAEGAIAARHGAMTAAPTAGTFVRGDIVWNSTPIAGGPIGWVCVVSGTPGTFAPFGGMAALGTAVATTSGTSVDVTGIPSWVTAIDISFVGVSTNGTGAFQIQIGDAGGIETSGYTSSAIALATGAVGGILTATDSFLATSSSVAAETYRGICRLVLENASSNTWTFSAMLSTATTIHVGSGAKALSAVLDRVRLTNAGGNTFDAGALNIRMM